MASDGRSTLARAASFRPDLMVLDVMLPDVDGFDVLKPIPPKGSAHRPILSPASRGLPSMFTGNSGYLDT